MWLWTVRAPSIVAPGMPSSSKRIRRKCSPTMCSPAVGSSVWISATRPARELSIGIMARAAWPELTSAKASSKLAQGTASQVGYISRQARCPLQPGSPW